MNTCAKECPGSARVSRVGECVPRSRTFLLRSDSAKVRFGETPKPARETRATQNLLARLPTFEAISA